MYTNYYSIETQIETQHTLKYTKFKISLINSQPNYNDDKVENLLQIRLA